MGVAGAALGLLLAAELPRYSVEERRSGYTYLSEENQRLQDQAGTLTDLGTLGGDDTVPYAINNLGQVVGYSVDAATNTHAFLWQSGTMVDLNSLLPTNSGWELIVAQFINDSHRIAGIGIYQGSLYAEEGDTISKRIVRYAISTDSMTPPVRRIA